MRRALGTCSRTAGSLESSPRRVAHAVKVLTAEVRRASVVRATPAAAWAASHDRKHRQAQARQPASGTRSAKKLEQRPQIAEVGAAGVLGAAALQREVLVELFEDRLHPPTVADARTVAQLTRRSASGVRSFRVG